MKKSKATPHNSRLAAQAPLRQLRHGICVAKVLDNTQSIIEHFGLATAAPCSPYQHTEIIYKSPEGLTKSVRFSGLFFLPRKGYSRGLHRITIQHGKVVNL